MKVLVTGANGFVGLALWQHLNAIDGTIAIAAVRRVGALKTHNACVVTVGDMSNQTDWTSALENVDVVVHTAARVHVMQDAFADPLTEYRRVNVQGTLHLARQAAMAGVKRFVFLSSVKVNGEATLTHTSRSFQTGANEKVWVPLGKPFSANDVPAPQDPYSISKMEAESGLREIAERTDMEVVIIRPPLVYGPRVKANFAAMMHWLAVGIPLPLGAITNNRRSFVALDNLVDLITTCLSHPSATNQTFLVSDGEDLSTADLLRRMGVALGKPARLFYMPPALLKFGATTLNKTGIYQRLCDSLQLDITKTRQLLQWTPPISVDKGLQLTAEGFSE